MERPSWRAITHVLPLLIENSGKKRTRIPERIFGTTRYGEFIAYFFSFGPQWVAYRMATGELAAVSKHTRRWGGPRRFMSSCGDFAELRRRHVAIYGARIATPRLIPAENAA